HIQNKIKDTDRTLKSLETQNKSDTIEREKDQKELEELRQALTTYFSSEQWFENWQSDPVLFVSRIKEFAKSWKDNIAELDSLLQKQGVQTEKRNGLEVQLNTTKEEVRLAQKKLSDLEVENKALAEKRTAIFDGAAVTEVEAELNVAIELAKQALDEQRLNVEKLQGALTRNIAQHEQLSKDINSLSKHEGALKEQLEGWIAKYNTRSETVLDEEKLINLLDFNQDWIEAERSSLRAI